MKTAITAENASLDAQIDPRFGRCSHFAIYDSETKKTEFFANPAKAASEGAGPTAVQFVAAKGVKTIIAGEFGGKIKSLLDSLHIEMKNENGKTIADIIKQL